jgi:hypothetical protein
VNPYVKIAIAAMAATYLSPAIMARFVNPPESGPEVSQTPAQASTQTITSAGVTGLVTAAVFTILTMATGGKAAV